MPEPKEFEAAIISKDMREALAFSAKKLEELGVPSGVAMCIAREFALYVRASYQQGFDAGVVYAASR
jgi:hypothetical protein